MNSRIQSHLPVIILLLAVFGYACYFSLFTINRYNKFYAHYFDLGIMNHAVYNTYKAVETGDASRLLEHSDPHGTAKQVKRMSIHNDLLLAYLSPFYFIHAGPETLLVIQSVILALGGVFVYGIGKRVVGKYQYGNLLALVMAIGYLMYPPLQKANAYEFHAVTLATTFLLGMYYFWLKKQYLWSFVFVLLSIFTKEQVGLTIGMFGAFIFFQYYRAHAVGFFSIQSIQKTVKKVFKDADLRYALWIISFSAFWVIVSMKVIIPYFRGGEHFASGYYSHIAENPLRIFSYMFRTESFTYLHILLSPVGYLSAFAPLQLLISLPDLLINLLSSNGNMRNIYFHYTSVTTPFVFISALYGIDTLFHLKKKLKDRSSEGQFSLSILVVLLITIFYYSYQLSSLPFAKNGDLFPWKQATGRYEDVMAWKLRLEDDAIKVSSTGRIAPHFTSRRYFYDFSWKYVNADYVIIEENDAVSGYLKKQTIPAYQMIQNDKKYIKIYERNGLIVYKKLS
jgi:uncharacterized membrane protein